MPQVKVAIISRMPPERARLVLGQAPPQVQAVLVDSRLPAGELAAACHDARGIVLGVPSLSLEVLRQCRQVALVQTLSAGYEELDVEGIAALGVPVANNGGANAVSVAEEVVGALLMLKRGVLYHWKSAKERRWRGEVGNVLYGELTGKTVGIVGLGNVGRAVARCLAGFRCRLLYTDILDMPAPLERELGVTRVPFRQLLGESDVVTLHVPLTPETRYMIGEAELGAMRPTAILVNAARGQVVDEKALYRALTAGRLAGAALDVLEQEPTPPDNPLLDLENVVITPHMAGVTLESMTRAAAFAFQNVLRAARGEPVESVVASPARPPAE